MGHFEHKGAHRQLALFADISEMCWLPDETLFSLASRHHALSGHVRASLTCEHLFGHAQRGAAHDLPSRMDEFVRRTHGELGDATSIIRNHTILPFYLPFRSHEDAEDALGTMRGNGIGALKYRLGILTSRFRAHHPLKACPQCIAHDREEFGTSYWHLSHQYPGVWICPAHGLLLLQSTVKANGVGRFLWHLPSENMLTLVAPHYHDATVDQKHRGALIRLAKAAVALARLPAEFHFKPYPLVATYRRALHHKGLCTGDRIRLREVGESFASFVTQLREIPELAAFPGTGVEAKAQVGRLLCLPRTGTHPLRHLLLILWLFDTWERFWSAFVAATDARNLTLDLFNDNKEKQAEATEPKQLERFLELVTVHGAAVTKAARIIGVDPYTGIAWAARAGIVTRRRSKTLTPTVLHSVVADLRLGLEKSNVAERNRVSVTCVSRTLRAEIGLHQAWMDARVARQKRDARRKWLAAGKSSGNAGAKAARLLAPAAYAWLYRNDRAWLLQETRLLGHAPRSNNASVAWDVRDRLLADAVKRACLDLATRMPGVRVSVYHVCQEISELRAKIDQLDRLPLTRRALEIGIGKPSRRKSVTRLV